MIAELIVGSLLIIGGLVLVFLAFAALVRRIARSRLVIRRFENNAYKEIRCPSCTLGTQYLHPDKGYGPIPKRLHMVVPGRDYIESPQANVCRCDSCGGNGYTATRDLEVKDQGLKEIL